MEKDVKYNGPARMTIYDDNDVGVCICFLMDEMVVTD